MTIVEHIGAIFKNSVGVACLFIWGQINGEHVYTDLHPNCFCCEGQAESNGFREENLCDVEMDSHITPNGVLAGFTRILSTNISSVTGLKKMHYLKNLLICLFVFLNLNGFKKETCLLRSATNGVIWIS